MQLLPWPSLAGKAPGDPGLCLLEKAPQQSTSPGSSPRAHTAALRRSKTGHDGTGGRAGAAVRKVHSCWRSQAPGGQELPKTGIMPRTTPVFARAVSEYKRPATAHGPACSTGSLVGAHRPGFPSRSQTWQEMKGFTSLAPISASSPCRMGRGELLLSSAARWDEFLPSGRASEPGARQRGAKGGKRRKGCGSCTRVNGNDPRHCRHLLSAPSLPLRHGLPPSCSPMPGFAAGERSRPSPTCCPASCQKGGRRQAPLATSAP
ncbi:uncharacterized protein LOC109282011 isoform X1 [Alligator mississippiensis]|uniref:uncharacterized protein LOC109282011 isoform X1 n=1 Tax=Alligator mississippiensis TaxID=8496 RepID=UPI00287785A1|nr:uncharacterized protein LOC109282011 isoform X1 [Alligator mississippiensis]XP_059574521.1 uncharacterized protein LOC109282011 isoform X1 [Alligator mississippiensis]